ncbi:MAG TPA: NUDIX domain-containing protein, partial [Croceibacterium sp.]
MLYLIPAPLHRLLYRVADRARRLWWRIRRPRRHSVVVIVFDDRGQVLLVRHSYGPPVWSLPGGGMARHEDPRRAAEREVREELGCGVTDLTEIDVGEVRDSGSLD